MLNLAALMTAPLVWLILHESLMDLPCDCDYRRRIMYPVLHTKRLNGMTLFGLFLISLAVLVLAESCMGYGVVARSVVP